MEFPERRTMDSLSALVNALEFFVLDDKRMIAITGVMQWWEVFPDELDELVERKWIELSEQNEISVTESGKYWQARWYKIIMKKGSVQ